MNRILADSLTGLPSVELEFAEGLVAIDRIVEAIVAPVPGSTSPSLRVLRARIRRPSASSNAKRNSTAVVPLSSSTISARTQRKGRAPSIGDGSDGWHPKSATLGRAECTDLRVVEMENQPEVTWNTDSSDLCHSFSS